MITFNSLIVRFRVFMNLSPYIDHTILKPVTTLSDVEQVYNEAVKYGFAAVCIPLHL